MMAQYAQRWDILRTPVAVIWPGTAAQAAPIRALGGAAGRLEVCNVRLLDGPFKRAQDLTARYLRGLQADRLLHDFHVNAGLPPKAQAYGGWEAATEWHELRCPGRMLAHYLSACSTTWVATGEAEFRRRVDYVVRELSACQQAALSGLVCAFPDGDEQLRNSLAGRAATGAPWATLRQLAAGLRDAHVKAGNALALDVLSRLADWIETAAEGCVDVPADHDGIDEVLTDLATLSGDARYLALARRFRARRQLGAVGTIETNGIFNMPSLARVLFRGNPQAASADWAERALVNGILVSKEAEGDVATAFQPLRPGYSWLHSKPGRWSTGTDVADLSRRGEPVFAADGDVLYVSQYIAAELAWREKGLRVSQVSAFPERCRVRLIIAAERATAFTMRLRHPSWCREMTVRVNGQPVLESQKAGRWVDVARQWRNGDTIDLELPMHLHLAPLPDVKNIAALMYGPMALAARMGSEGLQPGDDLIVNERTYGSVLQRPASMPRVALGGRSLHEAGHRVGATLRFRVPTPGDGADLEFIPYHQVAHEPYSLYVELA